MLCHGGRLPIFCCRQVEESLLLARNRAELSFRRSRGEPIRPFGVAPRNRFKGNFQMDQSDKFWWRDGIFYQIYPRSFQDSNGDGIGDHQRHHRAAALSEVARHRRHLAVADLSRRRWPISATTSPTMSASIRCSAPWTDFDALVAAAHGDGLKLILDLVPNHTSDQHPWFIESRALARQPEARLVPLARSGAGRRAAEQLDVGIRRQRLGPRRSHRAILLPRLPRPAARSELAQSGGARRHLRRDAVLAAQGRRRLSRRRDLAPDQGRRSFATTRPIRIFARAGRRTNRF